MSEPYTANEHSHAGVNGTSDRQEDGRWMRHALQLAEASIGLASPNPGVGCVLVRHGVVVGRGAHHYDTKDHAEVSALQDAGPKARGATAYVTLEPCSHTGRTPPCAAALISAGVSRVVAATGDPNPLVNGHGLAMLREAGIATTVGVLTEQARALNDGFARWIRRGLPFVTLKAGVSLDGRIAPSRAEKSPGSVAYLTGARSLLAVQRLRQASDAVLTGIGTVLEDNPLLTDRSGGARRRPLLRVVLDSQLRLPVESRLVQSAADDLLVITCDPDEDSSAEPASAADNGTASATLLCAPPRVDALALHERRRALEAASVTIRAVPRNPTGMLDLHAVLRLLGEDYQILNLLVEGGSQLNRALLDGASGVPIADKLCLFYAPIFLGQSGVQLLAGELSLPAEIYRSTLSECGSDFRLDAYLRDPWRDQ
jgi:diaminohydroxyphosphoribosylaminopyrimidine deaminase/5-amino-6-(5-phosphoribosylamino)uracil reductase